MLTHHKHTEGNQAAEDKANREADAKIVEITAAGRTGQDEVIKNLLSAVFDVHPTPVS